MDRRKFLETGARAAGAALAAGGGAAFAATKPNIVIIMADDLGYGDLGCFGSEAIKTPNLDRMAAEGVKLTSFYSSAPVCSPSRAGLLTGRYPIRTGVTAVFFPSLNPLTPAIHLAYRLGPGMDLKEITLAERLKTAGYDTCCIGKWHLGDMKPYRPNHRGFDHYLGVHYSNDMTPLPMYRNDIVVERPPADQNFFTQQYTQGAVDWIDAHHGRPFFLYMPHTFPHQPLHASPEFRGRSAGGLYGDCVEELDWSVGEVLATLDRHGIADNTLVFFTSDNGPWFQGSAGGVRGRKAQSLEGGMKVPSLARMPGVIPAGSVCNEMAMNFDLFTTACELAGAGIPDDRHIDGRNILPMLSGQASPHEQLYFFKGKELQAVRQGPWKYHRNHADYNAAYQPLPVGPFLFNLDTDPDESYDMSPTNPDKAAEMAELLAKGKKSIKRGL